MIRQLLTLTALSIACNLSAADAPECGFSRRTPMRETFAEMPRLRRWLGNVLAAARTAGDSGPSLHTDDLPILLTPEHPRFDELLTRLGPSLPPETLTDFLSLLAMTDAERAREFEAAINRLRSMQTPGDREEQ